MQVGKSEKEFIKEYIKFGVNHNFVTSKALLQFFENTADENEKKICYLGIYFCLWQLTEVFEMVIHSVKAMNEAKGFWGSMIEYNSSKENAEQFLNEAKRYESNPQKYFEDVFNCDINKLPEIIKNHGEELHPDFWKNTLHNIIQALTLKLYDDAKIVYNKVKHGFPIIEHNGQFLVFDKLKPNKKLDYIPFSYKKEEIPRHLDYIKFFTHAITNVLLVVIAGK